MNRPRSFSPLHYLFLAPALAVYGTFVLYPFARTVFLSLHSWNGFDAQPRWIGLKNYWDRGEDGTLLGLASDAYFRNGLWNNITYWLVTLLSEVLAGLALAALLARARRGAAIYRLALSSPLMIALVASGVLWRQILADEGLLNHLLNSVGLGALAARWLGDAHVVVSISCVSGWIYAGFYMLIFHAGLERIPSELREAAAIDGAGGWRVFFSIELPLLRPVLAVCVLLCSTGAFRAYDLFWVMVGTARSRSTEVASTWLVKKAFTDKAFGYASSIAVVMVVIVVSLAAVLNLWASRERELEY